MATTHPVQNMPDHTFLRCPHQWYVALRDKCWFCSVQESEHGSPSLEVVAGGAALRKAAPGWYKDGGGIWGVQESERHAAMVLAAAREAK